MERWLEKLNVEEEALANKNLFKILGIDSYKLSLTWLINIFNIIIIVSIFLFNYLLINYLFSNINKIYFTENIIEPISNEYEVLIQEINIRLKALDDMVIESKQENLRIISEHIFEEFEWVNESPTNSSSVNEIRIDSNFGLSNPLNPNQIENLKYFMSLIYKNSHFSIKANQLIFYIMNSTYYSVCSECSPKADFYKAYVTENFTFNAWAKEVIDKRSALNNPLNAQKDKHNEYFELSKSKNLSNKYYDRIVKNVYAEGDYTSYIKVMYFQNKIVNKNFDIFIGYKYSNEEFKNLLNRAGRNLTVIYKRDREIPVQGALERYLSNDDYAIIPCKDYLNFFYKYSFGIDNNILKDILRDDINYSAQEILKIHSWNSFSIKNILNSSLNINLKSISDFQNPKSEIFVGDKLTSPFNNNFFKEVLYLGFLITSSVRENFDRTFGNSILNEAKKKFINSSEIILTKQNDSNFDDKYVNNAVDDRFCYLKIPSLSFEFYFCRYLLNNDTISYYYPFESRENTSMSFIKQMEQDKNIDENTKEIKYLKHFNMYNDTFRIFLGSSNETDSATDIANKSFWIYISYINGLKLIFLEMLNYENYINLQSLFVRNIRQNFQLLLALMITICLIIFFLIFYFSIHFVNYSQKRIMTIVAIKNHIFYKQLSINYFKDINLFLEGEFVVEIVRFIGDCYERKVKKHHILKLKDDDDIDILKQNIFVSIKYGRKLERIVRKIMECDTGDMSIFGWNHNNEKKLKLFVEYNINNDIDSSENFKNIKEMNKLNMTRMEDISYNFNYSRNYFQENNFILYQLMEYAVEGKTISNERNGFFKSDEIIKIIYHIKKNIIQKSLNMIQEEDSTKMDSPEQMNTLENKNYD